MNEFFTEWEQRERDDEKHKAETNEISWTRNAKTTDGK